MARFLETYVRAPIQDMLDNANDLPADLHASCTSKAIDITVAGEQLHIPRSPSLADCVEDDPMPSDIDEELPGA